MCGINFIYSKKGILNHTVISQMMQVTAHRGPDFSHALHPNPQVSIAHNRLAIIDLSEKANQPFVVANRYYLSYNGEIYNFQDIKAELEKDGIQFHTQSDTEVLAQLLILKGAKGIELLTGMFAFVFYDAISNTVLANRDVFGIKPLYYFEDENNLIISSETRGIIASNTAFKELNTTAVNEYLNFKYSTQNTSIYSSISRIAPGEVMIHQNGQTTYSSYKVAENINLETTVASLKKRLEEGILKSLISDVPLGIFLSGGVDSTLIYQTIKSKTNHPLTCFYINIDHDLAEQRYLEELVSEHGDTLCIVDFEENFEDNFHDYIESLDLPVADSAAFLTWLLGKEAKKRGIKTVLSGAGGDELYAGYNRHEAFSTYLKWKNLLPFSFLKKLSLEKWVSNHKQRLIKKLVSDITPDPNETWGNFIRLSLPLKKKIAVTPPVTTLNEALRHDRDNYLTHDVLAITDQAGMAHGVEVRVPLLYLQPAIDSGFLLKHGKKWLLKKMVSIPNSHKKGFGIFLSTTILDTPIIANQLIALNNPSHFVYDFIDFEATQKMIQNHVSKKNNYSPEIWALIILNCWIKKHFS